MDEEFQSMAGSPQATTFQEGDHGGGAWSVTRISEVLHRRLVAPVLEHVSGGANQSGPSSSSARRTSTPTAAPDSLMSQETRRAMATWTARPTALTTPVTQAPQRDDVSDRSIQQEVVMEEVRRQVQLAMQGRDVELQELRSRNQELQKALDTSAQLLNDMMQPGGGGLERAPREDWQGPRDIESRGVPAGGGPSFNEPAGAPPGLVGPSWLPEGNLRGLGRQEPSLDDLLRRASGHEARAGSNPGQGGGGARPVFQSGLLGEGPMQRANEGREEADLSPLDVLVQGMKQLQQVYLDKKSPDAEALKGSVELPELPDLLGDTGVEFSDWLYVAEQIIGSLSDSANSWFAATLAVAKDAYKKHQQATPLERLAISPVIPVELAAARWKIDAVTHRVGTVAGILFRPHVLYAPGGVAERAHILKQLEGAAVGDNITEVIATLRRWRRNLTRAIEMGVSPPDASVLLKGIEVIIGGVLKRYPDTSFRLALARNDLQLQSRPTQDTVLRYFDHALAELQQAAPARSKAQAASDDPPRLRAADVQPGTGGTSQRTPPGSPSKTGAKQGSCKFFQSEQGCRRGNACKYTHEFASKDEKKNRCWFCGSKQHRQSDCPIKDPAKAKTGTAPANAVSAMAGTNPATAAPEPKARMAPLTTTAASTLSSSTTSEGTVVAAEPVQAFTPEVLQSPELQNFVKEVNTMLQRMSALRAMRVKEPVAPDVARMEARLQAFELQDVTLANGNQVTLQQNRAGLRVLHPEHGEITTHVSGACPFIGEARALELIGEIEARKLEQLKVRTLEAQLKMRGIEATVGFDMQLQEYRRTGSRVEGLKALMCEDSVFGDLTEAERCSLIQDVDLSDKAGHKYLKALPLKRAKRKRLMNSRWFVHLFAGNGENSEFKMLEEDGVTLLEIDVGVSKSFNLREPAPIYRALLWAAMRGQIHGVLGGPPRGEGAGDLVLKQMFVWMIARLSAETYEVAAPGFAMTLPTKSAFWHSHSWKSFRAAYNVTLAKGQPEVMLATTVDVPNPDDPWEQRVGDGSWTWTPEFKVSLVQGFQRWRMAIHLRRMTGPLNEMTKEELAKWIQHVRDGHLPYHRRCQTCVAAKAKGHAHRKIEAPSCYTMSLDVCGRFRVRGHTPEAMDQKYMLVASYVMPLLKGRKCGPEDEIINEPEGGVGDIPEGEEQDRDFVGIDDLFAEEEGPVEPPIGDVEPAVWDQANQDYNELVEEVGDRLNYQVLRFAVPMRSRRAAEVNLKVRQLYLQICAEGLPVLRCHSDRARELCNSRVRSWLTERGVLVTTGEAQSPQQNGRAESTVQFVKSEAKCLLTAAKLGKENWPVAMRYAVHRQRLKALGKSEDLPQFGCPVFVRTKIYGRAERYDMENKWRQGRYVGPSDDVAHGHVVKFEDNTFVTSQQMKAHLVDADALVDMVPREVELPLPVRRMRRKARLASVAADHPLSVEEERAEFFDVAAGAMTSRRFYNFLIS
ncbi:unnamed protein product [Symbiodinium sp. KB8]|nr:unnamed protein product [Symbiodinium sp. KB8]